MLWFIPCVLGGALTGWIGVSSEKVLFVLLSRYATIHLRTATITSITLVGWLSGVALTIHALSPRDPTAPRYIGAIPIGLWIVGLPGILVGSILGPQLNKLVGSRNILLAFALMLLCEGAKNTYDFVIGWDALCDAQLMTCTPQFQL